MRHTTTKMIKGTRVDMPAVSTSVEGETTASKLAFGKNLYRLMVEQGLSQSDLAGKAFGYETNNAGYKVAKKRHLVSRFINGKTFPKRPSMLALCKALNCTMSDLLPPQVIEAIETQDIPAQFRMLSDRPGMMEIIINRIGPAEFMQDFVKLLARMDRAMKTQGVEERTKRTRRPMGAIKRDD